ncbi:hypothetical protein O7634_21660 [Micromonospora sp. WMMD1120]|uniref:hypothetical protein n=1 Tax=Micromonospora sp. WMMD1120 TaxID=3016106 RepID=UPI002417E830|nr:hypothetical protein [Micromonospora sp. WMMD1120]MDG4809361.1 hypothetical protein [Micromonospora sp. WMMD1120]
MDTDGGAAGRGPREGETMATWAELSCYTSNLAAYLAPGRPRLRFELADAVRLAVLPATTALSHHDRVDGGSLGYRGAARWAEATAGMAAELETNGSVLAVANTHQMPWSPDYQRRATPHWVLLTGRPGGGWQVADHFAATTPHGEHRPYHGQATEDELRALLTPVGTVSDEVANRDRYALGEPVEVPPPSQYRWLVRTAAVRTTARPGWLTGSDAVAHLAAMVEDRERLAALTDDLWAASRHQLFRHRVRSAAGLTDPEATSAAVSAWEELPRALRFAVESAGRGRPRPGLVRAAFDRIITAGATA